MRPGTTIRRLSESGWALLAAGLVVGFVAGLLLADWPATKRAEPPVQRAATVPPAPLSPPADTPAAVPPKREPQAAAAPALQPDPPRQPTPQQARLPQQPDQPAATKPAWLRNAVAVPDPAGRPMIAVVIDDLGLNRVNTRRVIALPGPLTLAFMTYAGDLEDQTRAAHRAGHELMVHFPMEPLNAKVKSGPNTLEVSLTPAELRRRLDWGLSRFDGYVGVNNHMGSRFTEWKPGMTLVLEELHRRGLLFLDSRTIADSVAEKVAQAAGVPHVGRDVFLDNEASAEAVRDQLAKAEAIARRYGSAIAIGHPHDGTIEALKAWLPTLAGRGFALVPISAIVRRTPGASG